jgi:hypothetical protein
VGIVNKYPFSIFKRSDRTCFLVAFKTKSGKYLKPLSTGRKPRMKPFRWLSSGSGIAFPRGRQKPQALSVNQLALQDFIRKVDSKADAMVILKELQWKAGSRALSLPAARVFSNFLLNFWDWETSGYIEEKLRKEHGASISPIAPSSGRQLRSIGSLSSRAISWAM